MLQFVDELVERGEALSRSAVIARALEREYRRWTEVERARSQAEESQSS